MELQKLKDKYSNAKVENYLGLEVISVSKKDLEWLIEQVEMARAISQQNTQLNKEIGGYVGRVDAIAEEMEFLSNRLKLLKQEMLDA